MVINKQDIYSHYLTLNKNILTNRKMRFKFSHPNLLKQLVMVLAVAHFLFMVEDGMANEGLTS